MKKVWISLTF